jgi:UDP-N-acetylenolpyruvoylglucosamine reductase
MMNGQTNFEALRTQLSEASRVVENEPLAKRTTLGVGGPAEIFIEPASEADLALALRHCAANDLPVFVLGRGSNLLIRDGGIRGVVVSLQNEFFSRIEVRGVELHCGAGARLKHVANAARDAGLAGLEFLEGIPGCVGGALRMNAGAMGAMTFEAVERVRFMGRDGKVEERPAAEMAAVYRSCPVLRNTIALGAVLRGEPAEPETVRARMEGFRMRRTSSQPHNRSAGCMFKNPTEKPAGQLVDECRLKGLRVGGASVSDVHGNFIINDGGAIASDVIALIEQVREQVLKKTGIEMQTEVQIVGE